MKIIHRIVRILFVVATLHMGVGCSNDGGHDGLDIDVLPELITDAPFVVFTNNFTFPSTLSFADPNAAVISFEVDEANGAGTVARYRLQMTANLGNGTQVVEDFVVVENFPSSVTISAQLIADALGIGITDLSFGNSFAFIAIAEGTNGINAVGTAPNFDNDGFGGLGTISQPLIDEDGYNGAMNFGFTFACPAFDIEMDVAASYTVIESTFANFFGETNIQRDVVAGPGENQITIIGGEFPSIGSEDIIITIDTDTGTVTAIDESKLAWPEGTMGFPANTYLLVDGLVLPCSGNGIIDLTLNYNPFSGNPHKFVLEKQ